MIQKKILSVFKNNVPLVLGGPLSKDQMNED